MSTTQHPFTIPYQATIVEMAHTYNLPVDTVVSGANSLACLLGQQWLDYLPLLVRAFGFGSGGMDILSGLIFALRDFGDVETALINVRLTAARFWMDLHKVHVWVQAKANRYATVSALCEALTQELRSRNLGFEPGSVFSENHQAQEPTMKTDNETTTNPVLRRYTTDLLEETEVGMLLRLVGELENRVTCLENSQKTNPAMKRVTLKSENLDSPEKLRSPMKFTEAQEKTFQFILPQWAGQVDMRIKDGMPCILFLLGEHSFDACIKTDGNVVEGTGFYPRSEYSLVVRDRSLEIIMREHTPFGPQSIRRQAEEVLEINRDWSWPLPTLAELAAEI